MANRLAICRDERRHETEVETWTDPETGEVWSWDDIVTVADMD